MANGHNKTVRDLAAAQTDQFTHSLTRYHSVGCARKDRGHGMSTSAVLTSCRSPAVASARIIVGMTSTRELLLAALIP